MSDKIVLYDLACRGRCACWSPNVWKTRLVLNYKKIPYRTEWLTHPNIAPKLKEIGVPPAALGPGQNSPYTVPAVQFPDGTAISESTAIAVKLEQLHPDPSLHLDNGLPQKIGPLLGRIGPPLLPVYMPRINRDVLHESSVDHVRELREKKFGMTLDELEKTKGGEQAWEAAKPGLLELQDFIASQKRDKGPFILGSELCYADFIIAGMMEAVRRIGDDLYDKFVEVGGYGGLQEIHQACQKWLVDDQ